MKTHCGECGTPLAHATYVAGGSETFCPACRARIQEREKMRAAMNSTDTTISEMFASEVRALRLRIEKLEADLAAVTDERDLERGERLAGRSWISAEMAQLFEDVRRDCEFAGSVALSREDWIKLCDAVQVLAADGAKAGAERDEARESQRDAERVLMAKLAECVAERDEWKARAEKAERAAALLEKMPSDAAAVERLLAELKALRAFVAAWDEWDHATDLLDGEPVENASAAMMHAREALRKEEP